MHGQPRIDWPFVQFLRMIVYARGGSQGFRMVFQRITVDLWGTRFVFRPTIAGFRLHPKVASFSLPVLHPGGAGFNPLVACFFTGIGWFLSRFAGWRCCPLLRNLYR